MFDPGIFPVRAVGAVGGQPVRQVGARCSAVVHSWAAAPFRYALRAPGASGFHFCTCAGRCPTPRLTTTSSWQLIIINECNCNEAVVEWQHHTQLVPACCSPVFIVLSRMLLGLQNASVIGAAAAAARKKVATGSPDGADGLRAVSSYVDNLRRASQVSMCWASSLCVYSQVYIPRCWHSFKHC